MFVDACAIVAMMAEEDSAKSYEAALAKSASASTSALAAWEAIIVISRPGQLDCSFGAAKAVVLEWLEARNIELREASPRDVLSHAIAVAEEHGIGRRALSNFDCFHYAFAKALKEPLLTLDEKLRATDVETLP